MPGCRRARIRFETIHVLKTTDVGRTSEWEVNIDVAGQRATSEWEGLSSGSVIRVNRDFVVDMVGDNLPILVSGRETDWISPNDDLPTLQRIIAPIDNWENGQRFTATSPYHPDFEYSITFEMRCIDPQALTAGDGSNLLDEFIETRTQSLWRWCRRCQGLWYAGTDPLRMISSACPAGGFHLFVGSGNYSLIHNSPGVYGRQDGWRWCQKCEGAFFGRNHPNPSGRCPRGGAHDSVSSGLYSLIHNMSTDFGQQGWRWCNKCEGLFFTAYNSGRCPAGGAHDQNGSGEYSLILA